MMGVAGCGGSSFSGHVDGGTSAGQNALSVQMEFSPGQGTALL